MKRKKNLTVVSFPIFEYDYIVHIKKKIRKFVIYNMQQKEYNRFYYSHNKKKNLEAFFSILNKTCLTFSIR
jgi:hypothetical protein